MSDTDQHNGDNAKQESVQLLGLWAVTMVVAIAFITTLSARTSESPKTPVVVKHVQEHVQKEAEPIKKIAPPLDEKQTMAPLPAGHPTISQLQSKAVAPAPASTPEMPALPPGHPPLDAVPVPAAAPAPVATMHAPAEHAMADSHAQHEAHWGYEGEGGPEQWGTMKKEYLACGEGTQQSPVNIDPKSAVATKVGDIAFNYQPSPLEILNNGHTVQVNFAPGSSIQFGGKTFELLQFHFHSPSEHQIDYRYFDMEAHLVHKSADGELAVIGVMLNKGASNPIMDAVWEHIPHEINKPNTVVGALVNAESLLPANRRAYYHYMGSLTTPPCSEIVNWIVMQNLISVTGSQITTFVNTVGENNRPVQSMHSRQILTNVH